MIIGEHYIIAFYVTPPPCGVPANGVFSYNGMTFAINQLPDDYDPGSVFLNGGRWYDITRTS